MLGNPVTDEFSHQFLALTVPTDIDGDPNPYYDDLTNDDIADGRVAAREGYIRDAYHEADQTLDRALDHMGGLERDGGLRQLRPRFRPTVVRGERQQGPTGPGLRPRAGRTAAPVVATLVKECHAGGTVQLYIDLAGRDPANASQVAARQLRGHAHGRS